MAVEFCSYIRNITLAQEKFEDTKEVFINQKP